MHAQRWLRKITWPRWESISYQALQKKAFEFILCLRMWEGNTTGLLVEGRGQPWGLQFFLPECGSREWHSDHAAWWQVSLPTEPWPRTGVGVCPSLLHMHGNVTHLHTYMNIHTHTRTCMCFLSHGLHSYIPCFYTHMACVCVCVHACGPGPM